MAFLLLCVVCQIPISLSVLYTGANISTISIGSRAPDDGYLFPKLSKKKKRTTKRDFPSLTSRTLQRHFVGHLFLVLDRDLSGQNGYTVRAH